MRALLTALLCCLVSTTARAELPPRIQEPREDRQALASVPVPCLHDERERRVVVTWWIENKLTGERRAVGSREVRLRC